MAFTLFGKRKERPDNMLPEGWQFFSRPTNLEPPGAIFRIDAEGRKFVVERLKLKVTKGAEPGSSKLESIQVKLSIFARLVGLLPLSANVGGGGARVLEFEISEPMRESTTDGDTDRVLKPYVAGMEFKSGNRYFLVREVRTAIAMKYRITDQQLAEIGVKGTLDEQLKAGATVSGRSKGIYDVVQKFPERLGVMFLPDEIAPVRQGLAAGAAELGRIPLRESLDWVEPET